MINAVSFKNLYNNQNIGFSGLKNVPQQVNPQQEIKDVQLVKNKPDDTIKGFFDVTGYNQIHYPDFVKVNGKKLQLPDLNNSGECWQWWQKNIGEKPLSVEKKDRKRAKPLIKMPSRVKEKIIANLSRNGKVLTKYDNPELIKYRLDVNNRRIIIDTKDVKPTKKGQNLINSITNDIYDAYADSKKGIKKDKKLIVMLGQKAAGKTSLVDQMRKEHGVIVGDSDEIRDLIGYQETELHGRLKFKIKENLENKAIKENANYLAQFHGTGTKKTITLIKKFQQAGYDIEIMNIEVPEKELIKRIKTRKEKTGKNADPLSVILCGKKDQRNNYEKIVKKTGIDKNNAKRFNNDVPFGTPPIEIKKL